MIEKLHISNWFLVIRSIFIAILTIIACSILDVPTSTSLVLFSVLIGIFLGSKKALNILTTWKQQRKSFLLKTFDLTKLLIAWFLADLLIKSSGSFSLNGTLKFYILSEHLRTILIFFFLSYYTTILSVLSRSYVTAESISFLFFFLLLFAPHRNLRFDMPRFMNELSWRFGVSTLALFVIAGILFSLLSLLMLGTSPFKPSSKPDIASLNNQRRWGMATLILFLGLSIFSIVGTSIYSFYKTSPKGKFSNGVGEETKSGSSPLGFHSALGGTNQPSALVRLDNDYSDNPFSPMMYMRESALSQMSQNELVIASPEYDKDVARIDIFQKYETNVTTPENRKSVAQAVYMLSDQRTPFAIDFPTSISPLKVTNNKFRAAFKALSLAPVFKIEDIKNNEVGDPTWSLEERSHYLENHHDPRYGELAFKITQYESTPVQKALAISQYLSKTAIYTLSPNHSVAPGGDPVAPFLFGDHRGYCVHFAHATVYMLRSIGIPSRIGTGYLTDFSQAKDGHILLRMSDRHAWAEVYINNIGWVPFDTQPEQVESHAETEVDQKLLEELMGLLEPDEDILPKDIDKDEKFPEEETKWEMPDKQIWLYPLALLVLLGLVSKIYIRNSYSLTSDSRKKAYRAYRAHASRLLDAGFKRDWSETRIEYHERLKDKHSSFSVTHPFIKSIYSNHNLNNEEIASSIKEDKLLFSKLPFWRKLLSYINPSSVIAFWGRSKW